MARFARESETHLLSVREEEAENVRSCGGSFELVLLAHARARVFVKMSNQACGSRLPLSVVYM